MGTIFNRGIGYDSVPAGQKIAVYSRTAANTFVTYRIA